MLSSGNTRDPDTMMTDMSNIESILESLINSPPLTTSLPITPVKTDCGEAARPTPFDDDGRPKHSYLSLTTMALQDQPGRQCNLKAIYEYISTSFPYYTKNRKHWKNSVRHNLALHKCFKRLDTEDDRIIKGNRKKLRNNPLWALVSVPDSCKLLVPRRARSKTAGLKKRKSGNSMANEKSSSSNKPKIKANSPETKSPTAAGLSTSSPLMSISMMLPNIGSTNACPPSSSTSMSQGLLQPPVTPESDYGSLCSDRSSPYIPEHSFEHPPNNPAVPSPSLGLQNDDGFSPLPRLSVHDICAVLQCDEFPRSPDSGTGVDLLDGFGWLDDESTQGPTEDQYLWNHPNPQPCLADTLLDDDSVFAPRDFVPQPAAVSYFVPKVPVERSLSVSIQNFSF